MDYRGSNHASVVGLAVTAFVANNVEEDFSNVIAVVAEDPHLQNHCKFNLICIKHEKNQSTGKWGFMIQMAEESLEAAVCLKSSRGTALRASTKKE